MCCAGVAFQDALWYSLPDLPTPIPNVRGRVCQVSARFCDGCGDFGAVLTPEEWGKVASMSHPQSFVINTRDNTSVEGSSGVKVESAKVGGRGSKTSAYQQFVRTMTAQVSCCRT